jgi:hypothetical protein
MAHHKDVGRTAMLGSHGVFAVHDIPPAAYFGPGIPSGVKPEFRSGDVCSRGLWDEAVDEPVAYPFVADNSGFCYIPRYDPPNVNTRRVARAPPIGVVDPEKPRLQTPTCGFTCRWSD